MMAPTQRRCGSPVTGAAPCPDCHHQDGSGIHSPPSPRAVGLVLGPAASPLMESGSSPTLCLCRGGSMCPGRFQQGYFSWEEPAPAPLQSCSPPPPTPQQLTSVCHMIPSNNCVASLGYCRDRVEILRALTKDGTRPRLGPGVDLAQLGADTRCEGFSGADVGNLVRQVRSPTEIVS